MNIYLRDFVKNKKIKTAFDFGCGEGFDIAMLNHLGIRTEGSDLPDLDMNYPQKVGKYDLVYSNCVLPFVDNKKVFIDNLYNNLKKEGYFFVSTFSREDKIFKEKGMTKEEIFRLFKNRGFKEIKVEVKSFYDNEIEHRHWHKLLIVKGQKK